MARRPPRRSGDLPPFIESLLELAQGGRWKQVLGIGAAVLLVLAIALRATWKSFFHYVEPGQMLIVISKSGDPLDPGQILARPGQKGVQEEVLGEGRHFVMPVSNEVEIVSCLEVKPGSVGVVTAKTGTEPPAGRILVDKGEKGVWREVLPPGRYRLNPHGYKVDIHPAVRIRPGAVGFVTSLVGEEPKGRFAEEGERGMRLEVLEPGVYYLNPYAVRVVEIEVGIDQVSFLDDSMIRFPSADAFEIRLESTVEWELVPAAVPEIMAEFGTPSALEEKVLVPQSKSIGRLAGSRYGAKDFLLGEGREKFQQAFTDELVRICEEKFIDIHSAFIRHITIPPTLLKPIQESFISVEKEKTAKFWEETRKSAAELEREQALILQRREEVEAETRALVRKLGAEAEREVGRIEGETRRQVAAKQEEIASLDAQRARVLGEARAEVEKAVGAARASLFAYQVDAFGGDALALRSYAFAEALPAGFGIHLVQAGEGTFWTDLGATADLDSYVKLKYLRDGGLAPAGAPGAAPSPSAAAAADRATPRADEGAPASRAAPPQQASPPGAAGPGARAPAGSPPARGAPSR